jgi:hypothetical protein
MRAFKLFTQRADGTIGPLFINRRQRIPTGVWLPAEDYPTKGFANRPGWHAGREPNAPHLGERGRVWYEVEIEGYRSFKRPTAQGGEWLIADWMKVLRPC